jgi:hypothetical protein
VKKGLHEEGTDFYQKKISTRRSRNHVGIDIAWFDKKFNNLPENKKVENNVGNIKGKHKIGQVPRKRQAERKRKHKNKQYVFQNIFPFAFFDKNPYTGNTKNNHVDGPNNPRVIRQILKKNTNEEMLNECQQ